MAGTSTSGNYGHLGRPGQVGGSIAVRRTAEQRETDPRRKLRDQPLCPTLEELADQRGMDVVPRKKKKKRVRRLQPTAA